MAKASKAIPQHKQMAGYAAGGAVKHCGPSGKPASVKHVVKHVPMKKGGAA